MKKNRFLVVVLTLIMACLCVSMVGCGKKKISPPTITNVYQEGLDVYVAFEPLHNPYTPEFSLDGVNWYFPSNFQNNAICMFTYNTNTKQFVSMNNALSVGVGQISVRIRELEGPDTLTTDASNVITYTLVEPKI